MFFGFGERYGRHSPPDFDGADAEKGGLARGPDPDRIAKKKRWCCWVVKLVE